MKVLIAEDSPVSRHLLHATLIKWGYDVLVAEDGLKAWEMLEGPDAPPIALLDWGMPGLDGLEICRRVRERSNPEPTYLILLTGRSTEEDIVVGLQSGANDYITKPFNRDVLHARVQVGQRVVELQANLAARIRELEDSIGHVTKLQGLLPICAWCKNVRDDQNYWQKVEDYVETRFDAHFTHGICPTCKEKAMAEMRK